MPSIISHNTANSIVKLIASRAPSALTNNLLMGNLSNCHYDSTPTQIGDVVTMPIPLLLTTGKEQNLVMPAMPTPITINRHCQVTFQIPDITAVLAFPALLPFCMGTAIISLAEQIESDILNLHASFTANAPLGAAGFPLSEILIDTAETVLFNARVPYGHYKYLIVDPATYHILLHIPGFDEFQTASEAGLEVPVTGRVGTFKNFFVFRSHYVAKTSNPVAVHNLAFAQDAIGLAVCRPQAKELTADYIVEYGEYGNLGTSVTMKYQPDTISQEFTIDIMWGCGILRNSFGVQVIC